MRTSSRRVSWPPSSGDRFAPRHARVTAELNARRFETRYRELIAAVGGAQESADCVECVACRACTGSTFCRESERLVRCHYCVRCSLCTDCSHCRSSRGLIGCSHCVGCESSSASSYLVRCVALTGSSYCFGCVGLSGKDFHILNEPYERAAYFAVTQRLGRELGL